MINISQKATSESNLSNLLVETKQDSVIFKATNYDLTFEGEFPALIEEAGSISVQTAKLNNLVKNFIHDEIEFQSTPQHWVFLTNGKSKIKLPGLEPSAYPQIEFKPLEQSLSLDGRHVVQAIERTLFAIGENESRKNLMGLNMQVDQGQEIRWLGADAFRISHEITELDQALNAKGNIIIPKRSLGEIKKILDYCHGEVRISFDENLFQLESEKIKFKTRLIEADYPNLEAIVSALGPIEAKLPRAELIRAVRLINTVTDMDPNSVMKLTLNEGIATIESQKLEMGEGNDEIRCDYQGEEISVGLNINFFLECLQVFDASGDEEILINLTGPVNPVVLRTPSWGRFRSILMPVKIKW